MKNPPDSVRMPVEADTYPKMLAAIDDLLVSLVPAQEVHVSRAQWALLLRVLLPLQRGDGIAGLTLNGVRIVVG